jgi:serine/threonine protein kinase
MTSDGLPGRERAACLAAGSHPHIVAGLGYLTEHPEGAEGLLMPRVPDAWRVLAEPPSAESCSRDVYAAALRFPVDVALRIARSIGSAAAHLFARGLIHGDLYAHNTLWDGSGGDARLSDFGAASFLTGGEAQRYSRLEVRAWAILLGELLDRCEEKPCDSLRNLHRLCALP